MKRIALFGLALATFGMPTAAFAGGFEFPDNGTEALGRGGTFTAKADSPLAVQYNLGGLAKQRGTRLLFDSNLVFQTYEFQRAGVYPDSPSDVPYGGMPYPKVHNTVGTFYAPFLGLTTDFNYFRRWTFAFGVFGPSAFGHKEWGVSVPGTTGAVPAPQRYDITSANLLEFFPTLAASVRVTKWFDLGLALHLAVGIFDLSNVSFTDLGSTLCKTLESASCDSGTRIRATGFTATAGLGAMFHAGPAIDIGVNFRGPIVMNASGTVDATPPAAATIPIPQDKAEFHSKLPPVIRAGVRYKFLGGDKFEHGDIEVDGTWEGWSWAEGDGDKVIIPNLGPFSDIHPTITHHFKDTFSVRLGGAYNLKLSAGVLSFRLGAYYDSSATAPKDTRVDFDTMEKIAGTAGLGYSVRGVTLNVGYAYIWSPDRNVTDGDIQSINGVANGDTTTSQGPTPVINNGHYHANNMVLSFGVQIAWDELLRRRRIADWN
jgi:Outer membrane protein transport protein (OMPP1/FadL/TodX)